MPYTVAVKERLGLSAYFGRTRTQTTSELLNQADLIIFMNDDVYRDAKKKYDFNPDKAMVWHVKDMHPYKANPNIKQSKHEYFVNLGLRTGRHIQSLCESLVHDATKVSWTDIVDEDNNLRGFRLPISWACQKGLWWRGSHAVITLPNGKYLVEKRSKTIVFAPGMIDITLGGAVDSGETPLDAVRRETKEELGLTIPADQFRLIDSRKLVAYHPRYRVRTRIFLFTYHGQLATNTPEIKMQRKEVATVVALSFRQIRWLIRYHRLRSLGLLKTSYRYFDTIVAATRAHS